MNSPADAPRPCPDLPADPMTPSRAVQGKAALPVRRVSRRASLLGSAIAILIIAGLGALAWFLTQAPAKGGAPAAGMAGRPGGPAGGGGPPGGGGGGRRAGASTVGVAVAERASIPVYLDALGTVTPQVTVRVRPQVSGVLEKILFTEGQMVKKGDVLATIDPRQFEMALQQASGQRQQGEAQLESARVTLQRFRTLLEQDSIARQEVDSQAALVKQLEGTIAVNKAGEGAARLNLGYTRVLAPISGRVGLRTVDVGNVVSTSDANGVAVITQLAPIDVVFAVPQDQAGELQQLTSRPAAGAGMKVTVLDRSRANVLETGVFASLDNQIDTSTGTVKAKARFANSSLALFPSQFVNVQVLVRTIDNAVLVPVAAVRKGSTGDYVFVLNPAERTVALRPVQRGQATMDKVVISSGLEAGEQVITEGADRLKDGSPVLLPGDAPRGAPGAGGGANRRRRAASDAEVPGASPPAAGAASATSAASAPAAGVRPQRVPAGEAAVSPPPSQAPLPPRAQSAAPAPAVQVPAPVTSSGPTPEQRQRMLARLKDDPEALAQRQRFFEQLDKGDPEALARWQTIQQRRQQQGERAAP